MFYVSSKSANMYGVTDTLDGVEEFYKASDLFSFVRKGIKIVGVEGNTISVVKFQMCTFINAENVVDGMCYDCNHVVGCSASNLCSKVKAGRVTSNNDLLVTTVKSNGTLETQQCSVITLRSTYMFAISCKKNSIVLAVISNKDEGNTRICPCHYYVLRSLGDISLLDKEVVNLCKNYFQLDGELYGNPTNGFICAYDISKFSILSADDSINKMINYDNFIKAEIDVNMRGC